MDLLIKYIASYYLWLKVGHIVSFVAWMVGLFYLPRLFVYHTQVETNSEVAQTFQIMEERLYRIIIMPAMHATFTFGILLIVATGDWRAGWLHAKLTAVLCLVIFQLFLKHCRISLKNGTCNYSKKFFIIINEIPTVLLIIITILIVIKPF